MKKIKIKICIVFFVIACSASQVRNKVNDPIVIVNVGIYNRAAIAKQIEFIKGLNPKVIAIDLMFDKEYVEYQDSLLASSLIGIDNLVMSTGLDGYNQDNGIYSTSFGTLLKFIPNNANLGYTNVILEEGDIPIIKRFSTHEMLLKKRIYHFAIQTSMLYDSLKTTTFVQGNNKIVDIRYKGNRDSFKIFSAEDALSGKISANEIAGKIVLFGYAGSFHSSLDSEDEDMFYTPLSSDVSSGKPDMYGVVYLANIINQILTD